MKRVLVFGTFDILHPGHIYFLKQARKFGDFLTVSVARKENTQKIKGAAPLHSDLDRKKLLQAIKFVDKVVLGVKEDYIGHILKCAPDVIVLGYDQKAYTARLKEKLAKRGLKVKVVRLRPYKAKIYMSRKLLIPSRF